MFLKRVFYIETKEIYKIFYFMGFKIKFKSKYLVQCTENSKLNNKILELKKRLKLSEKNINNMQNCISYFENIYLEDFLSNIEPEKFSVIIPTLQKNTVILNLLVDSLIKDNFVDEILIIDNSLKGGLHYNSSKVKFLPVDNNLFVNPAWNCGMEHIKNDYFALLNDDLLLPDNFFAQVSNFIKKNPDCGLIGLESSTIINQNDNSFDMYPEPSMLFFKPIPNIHKGGNNYWGSAIFGKKENYYKIPKDILIWCGDTYLLLQNNLHNKKCYAIYNTKIKHYCGLSSGCAEFDEIKQMDKKLYLELKNALLNEKAVHS